MTTYHIGIDPGSGKNNGFAVVRDDEHVAAMHTCTRRQILSYAVWDDRPDVDIVIHIEDPRLIPTIYARNRSGNPGKDRRIAQNVGQNKAVAAAIIEDLEALGLTVHRHAPSGAKWDAATVRALGWTGRSSQHARDALRVALQGMRKLAIEGAVL